MKGIPITIPQKKRHSEPSQNKEPLPLKLNTQHAVVALPKVADPWEVRYDSNLSSYYFYNKTTNEAQFDHPEEVNRSPISSPLYTCPTPTFKTFNKPKIKSKSSPEGDKKSFFTSNLKRTLSPKNLFSKDSESKNMIKSYTFPLPESPSSIKSNQDRTMSIFIQRAQSISGKLKTDTDTETETEVEVEVETDIDQHYVSCSDDEEEDEDNDEDFIQFRKYLRQEMQTYESQRLGI